MADPAADSAAADAAADAAATTPAPLIQGAAGLKIAHVEAPAVEENERRTRSGKFTLRQLRQTDGLVPLQSGTNQFDSQKKGMTGFGTPRDVRGKHLKRLWELEFPEEALDESRNGTSPDAAPPAEEQEPRKVPPVAPPKPSQ
ncbi:unnamed protein product [Gongylonema pulchrum]|uniref:Uncharacterized protein n=1 Tax=Gongylonema pulchrum TaxID=637853 RepID=A0A183DUQ9_9BILA|nr:unnamed protein product [Gongylonema pulchrum]